MSTGPLIKTQKLLIGYAAIRLIIIIQFNISINIHEWSIIIINVVEVYDSYFLMACPERNEKL
jgi:hypothetical protein